MSSEFYRWLKKIYRSLQEMLTCLKVQVNSLIKMSFSGNLTCLILNELIPASLKHISHFVIRYFVFVDEISFCFAVSDCHWNELYRTHPYKVFENGRSILIVNIVSLQAPWWNESCRSLSFGYWTNIFVFILTSFFLFYLHHIN